MAVVLFFLTEALVKTITLHIPDALFKKIKLAAQVRHVMASVTGHTLFDQFGLKVLRLLSEGESEYTFGVRSQSVKDEEESSGSAG